MLAKKFRLISTCFVLVTIALLAASCNGFFVDPTLTSVSVGPQNLSLTVNETFQMTATGTYSDGTQKTLTKNVTWSSSDSSTVSVARDSGQVTGLKTGSATISASSGGCSSCTGTTTVTVAITGVTSVSVTPGSQSVTINGSPVFFHATANGTDVTDPQAGTTWTILDSAKNDQTANFTLSFVSGSGTGTGEGIAASSSATAGTYTVQATYQGVTGTATLTVN